MDTTDIFTRLQKEIDLYMDAYPEGISTPEVADILGVTRQTVHKDLGRIEEIGFQLIKLENNRYTINPKTTRPLTLSVTQTWFLYLPLRRMVRSQLHRYPFVYELLRRISRSLNVSIADGLIQDMDKPQIDDDIFTRLTKAWQDQTLVEVKYKPLNETTNRHLIAPYWFEPAVWSDSIYVIAGLVRHDGTLTAIPLKVDRIQSVIPRDDSFEAPSQVQILDEIRKTWGIWNAEDVTHVVLRFGNRVQERLRETRWHPTEVLTEQDDGTVLWEAYIAEPKEMIPWIRGWGADVEVLEPDDIRQQIALDVKLAAQLYGQDIEDDGYF